MRYKKFGKTGLEVSEICLGTWGIGGAGWDAHSDEERMDAIKAALDCAFASVKPELSAPGVDITTTLAGGGYTVVSGTSFAVPFVTGAAALLMEYGIVRKNDPYLYGDKLKAYLLAGARPLRGVSIYPDIRVGFGALCLENSFPD